MNQYENSPFKNSSTPLALQSICSEKTKSNNEQIADIFISEAQNQFSQFCSQLSKSQIDEFNISGCPLSINQTIDLCKLIRIKSIRYLNVSNCGLDFTSLNYLLQALQGSPDIQSLALSHLNFDQYCVLNFTKFVLDGRCKLKKLQLNHSAMEPKNLTILILNFPNLLTLEQISITHSQYDYESLFALGKMMSKYVGSRRLIYFDISSSKIQDFGIKIIEEALQLTYRSINIISLNLSNNGISQNAINSLEQILLKCKTNTELNLSQNRIEDFSNNQFLMKYFDFLDLSDNMISEIPQNFFPNVVTINISSNKINIKAAYQISQILSKVSWRSLILNDNLIFSEGFISIIFALRENYLLQNLEVANNYINGTGILGYMLNHEHLNIQRLNLSRNIIRYEIVQQLLHTMKICKLRELNLSKLSVDSDDICLNENQYFEIKLITSLNYSNNPRQISFVLQSFNMYYNRIEMLNLSGCQIKSELDMQYLANIITLSKLLVYLDLSHNQFGQSQKQSLLKLSTAFAINKSIINLNLSHNHLKGKITFLIDGLSKCSGLINLNLSNNKLNDQNQINIILRNNSIQYLDLSNNQISDRFFSKNFNQNKITFLNISHCNLCSNDLLAISNFAAMNDLLVGIDLSNNKSLQTYNQIDFTETNIEIFHVSDGVSKKRSLPQILDFVSANIKSLKAIYISSIYIPKEDQRILLYHLQRVKEMVLLSLSNQLLTSESMISLIKMTKLKYLQIQYCKIDLHSYQILTQILAESQKLVQLDLENIKFSSQELDQFCEGLQRNRSILQLKLTHCNINDDQFEILIRSIAFTNIYILNLNDNCLTTSSIITMINTYVDQEIYSKINELHVKNNQIILPIGMTVQKQMHYLQKLSFLDMSFNSFQLTTIFNKYVCFQSLDTLILTNCKIKEEFAVLVVSININIKFINLSNNLLEDQETINIISQLQSINSRLEILDLSHNLLSGHFIEEISHKRLHNLKILMINQNSIRKNNSQKYIEFLTINSSLFIYNEWYGISQELGMLILDRYKNLYIDYKINSNDIPIFMQKFVIKDSLINDAFCQQFSQFYCLMIYLEVLNLSDNQFITNQGRSIIYINLINFSYSSYILKQVKIRKKDINIFDEGILRYLLIRLKAYILDDSSTNPTIIAVSTLEPNVVKLNWIRQSSISLLNFFFQHYLNSTDQQRFVASDRLYQYIRQRKKMRKVSLIGTIVELIKIIFCSLVFMSPMNYEIGIKKCIQDLESNFCFINVIPFNFYLMASLILIYISAYSLINFIYFLKLRKKITPSYVIVTDEMKKQQFQKYPNKVEILCFLYTQMVEMNYLIENLVIFSAFSMLKQIQQIDLIQTIKIYFIIVAILIIQISKILFRIYVTIQAQIQLNDENIQDNGTFLRNLWIKSQYDFNYIAENFLSKYTPQSSIKFFGIYFNSKQLLELQTAIIELIIFILLLFFIKLENQILQIQTGKSIFPSSQYFFYSGLIKGGIKIIVSSYITLTCRPPDVQLSDLNSTLQYRKYKNQRALDSCRHNYINKLKYTQIPAEQHIKEIQTLPSCKGLTYLKNKYN